MIISGCLVSVERNQMRNFFAATRCLRAVLAFLISLVWGITAQGAGCLALPNGALAWWPGDGNAASIISTNSGTLLGGATVSAAGYYGIAFTFEIGRAS